MGRAMLIICSGVLIAMGFMSIASINQGKMLTQKTATYADYTMAKNAAHTAIQMAMQEINKDEENRGESDYWPKRFYSEQQSWSPEPINGRNVILYMEYEEEADYWEPERLRMISIAEHEDIKVEVVSQYMMSPFSTLVPEFEGAVALPGGFNSFNADGNAHSLSGKAPEGSDCEDKPAVVVRSEEDKNKLPGNLNTEGGSEDGIGVNPDLSYEPTDELIERLWNSGNATSVTSDFSESLGSPENPGIFFIDEETVRLSGGQSEGYGILVIRSGGYMEYEGGLDIRGNFEFNGLVIFENAFDFDGRGTPTINGSVLIGNTEGYDGTINVDLGGNIHLQYDCEAEQYAQMATASAVAQNQYKRVVTTENNNYTVFE